MDYGVDAPGVIRNFLLAGIALLVLARFVPVTVRGVTFLLSPMFRSTAIGCIASGVLMVLYSKFMKFRHRDKLLGMVNWRGDERCWT